MLIKLTNMADEHQGNDIFINSEWIVAVFTGNLIPDDIPSTIIYGGPMGTSWNVKESPEEIQRLMNPTK